jgi:hypothetical protein
MTYCYYLGKPTVIPVHACYRYCYILLGSKPVAPVSAIPVPYHDFT